MLFDKTNVFRFPVYAQTFTVEFASVEEAENANASVAGLPFEKKVALTTRRWDDSNPGHLKPAQTLAKNGWKGSFYLNNVSKEFADVMKKTIAMGMSVGGTPAFSLAHAQFAFLFRGHAPGGY